MASIAVLDSQPYLAAAILQVFLYAFYLVSFVRALRWLLTEEDGWTLKSHDKVNWLFLTITILVFALSTADLAFEVMLQLTSSGGLDSQANHLFTITSTVMKGMTLLITDAVLIIRCWLVYQRSWRVVYFPLMPLLANIALFIRWITVYTVSVFELGITHNPVSPFALRVFYCCNCTTVLYATSAIVYRVGMMYIAGANSSRSSTLYRICFIAAAIRGLYALTSLPLLVTAFFMPMNMSPFLICDVINFSTAGITFNLLLITVDQIRAEVEMGANGSKSDEATFSTLGFGSTLESYGYMTLVSDTGEYICV